MASMSGDGSFNDSSSLDGSFANKPWPRVAPQKQAEIERRFFEPGATIRFDQLPPARGFIFSTIPQGKRSELVVSNVLSAATAAKRRLNQSEIDALSESANHAVARLSWVYPLGLGLAVAAAANGRKTFRFPFYTPKMKVFDPRAFPHRSFATLTGKSAVWAWHGIRTSAYYPLTWFASLLFLGSMVRTRLLADLASDQRLSQIKEAVAVNTQRNAQLRREQRQRQAAQSGPPGANQPPDAYTAANQHSGQDSWTGIPQSQVLAESPGLGSPGEPSGPIGRSGPSPTRQQGLQGWSGRGGTQEQQGQTSFDEDDLFEDDDDASPVAASTRRSERQRAQTSASQGGPASSWDTIRQQARKESSPFARGDRSKDDSAWGRARQDGARTTRDAPQTPPREGYSYNEADEEKAFAKNQAQNEFDAMLEAERQGRSGSR
ncbi:hypothetical protein PG985_001007 [Apiospora marii]|uniref:Uncharacterized protein n=1 Tax=Apiospora marii TaxID=335849 RepID=A0ABR1RH31_9PEZI